MKKELGYNVHNAITERELMLLQGYQYHLLENGAARARGMKYKKIVK